MKNKDKMYKWIIYIKDKNYDSETQLIFAIRDWQVGEKFIYQIHETTKYKINCLYNQLTEVLPTYKPLLSRFNKIKDKHLIADIIGRELTKNVD